MASQQDLHELLRVITARKVPMMTAMSQVKALQAVNLRSIQQIADSELGVIESALGHAKTARYLQSTCKAHVAKPGTKRGGDLLLQATGGKRARTSQYASSALEGEMLSLEEQENALALPVATDEEDIAAASIYTNRAPLMLAFVVELLRCTMPEQPLSSRLSLAQAVVSVNSRSKAAGLGLTSAVAEDSSWSEGQPKVTIMGRTVAVLKRGDYRTLPGNNAAEAPATSNKAVAASDDAQPVPSEATQQGQASKSTVWATSRQITVKSSTFIAHVATLDESTQAPHALVQALLSSEPHLQTATHNAWGYRLSKETSDGVGSGVREACEDDGENGCGEFILRLMREAGVVGAVVVLTRWFGGEMLGTDRWRLMRECVTEALSERLRLVQDKAGHDGSALWALDLQSMDSKPDGHSGRSRRPHDWDHTMTGAAIHRPESARAYLLKNFASGSAERGQMKRNEEGMPGNTPRPRAKKTSRWESEAENLQNLARLLGALRLLFESWTGHLTPSEMDRRAWSWYVGVRPEVEPGPAGWGAKGWLKLSAILEFRRKEIPIATGKGTGEWESGSKQ